MSPLIKRPKAWPSTSIRMETGCGKLYIHVSYDPDTKLPTEVFASLGKSGGCATCQLEGMSRAITIGLRSGIPVDGYIKQLSGIKCPSPAFDSGEKIESCADAVSKVLAGYIKENFPEGK